MVGTCADHSNQEQVQMANILILGAHGQIARVETALLLEQTDACLTLICAMPQG